MRANLRVPRSTLTERETAVLTHYSRGLTQEQIGRAMWLSPETVKSHLKHIRWALDARNSAHAVAIAMDKGLIKW